MYALAADSATNQFELCHETFDRPEAVIVRLIGLATAQLVIVDQTATACKRIQRGEISAASAWPTMQKHQHLATASQNAIPGSAAFSNDVSLACHARLRFPLHTGESTGLPFLL